jgi:hypothetical protein
VVWNLRYHDFSPYREKNKFDPVAEAGSSTLVLPGKYSVSVTMVTGSGLKEIGEQVSFNVVPLNNCTLPALDRNELVLFQKKANELSRSVRGTESFLNDMIKKVENIRNAIVNSPEAPFSLLEKANILSAKLGDMQLKFRRDSNKPSVEETPPSLPTFNERLSVLAYTHWRSTSCITKNEENAYEILAAEFPSIVEELNKINDVELKILEDELEEYGVPWTPGRIPVLRISDN